MLQSPLTRFQGAVLGMYVAQHAQSSVAAPSGAADSLSSFKNYALLVGASVESILHCRGFDIDDWLASVSRLITEEQMPIAILPIALYLHDDVPRLQATIQQIGDLYQFSPESMASLIFLATGLAELVAENCQPENFVPHILRSTQPFAASAVANQLQLIHQHLIVNADLPNIPHLMGAVVAQGQPYLWPVAMASYCFLSNPQHWRLSVDRAIHIPSQSALTLALTGMLGGASQGSSRIPAGWCVRSGHAAEQLMQLAEKLWVMWAGVYQPSIRIDSKTQIVTAPGRLQPRN